MFFKKKDFEISADEARKLTIKTKIDWSKRSIEPFILEAIFKEIKEATQKGLSYVHYRLEAFPPGIPCNYLAIEEYFKRLKYNAEFRNTDCFSQAIITIYW